MGIGPSASLVHLLHLCGIGALSYCQDLLARANTPTHRHIHSLPMTAHPARPLADMPSLSVLGVTIAESSWAGRVYAWTDERAAKEGRQDPKYASPFASLSLQKPRLLRRLQPKGSIQDLVSRTRRASQAADRQTTCRRHPHPKFFRACNPFAPVANSPLVLYLSSLRKRNPA